MLVTTTDQVLRDMGMCCDNVLCLHCTVDDADIIGNPHCPQCQGRSIPVFEIDLTKKAWALTGYWYRRYYYEIPL
jgi:hypothetical protein